MVAVQPERKSQSIGDATIDYLSYDRCGDGPPVVMLHATGFMAWTWHPVARRLAERFRVFAPDLFRHRWADPHKGGVNWLELAEDIKLFCDRLGLENVSFVGHSMGGVVSTLAHTSKGVPAARMVLIEPIILPQPVYGMDMALAYHPLAAKAIKRRNSWPDKRAALDFFRSKPFFQSWDEEMLSLYATHGTTPDGNGGIRLTCPPEIEAAMFMGGHVYDPWPELPKVTVPTLVVEGGISENRALIDLKKITSLIPGGRYTEVAGAGHLVPMEKPAETFALIDAFLTEA